MKTKIWVYGKPFSGKTTFANSFPKPFHINTDGNAQFVTNDYEIVKNIEEFSKAVDKFFMGNHDYETLVVDVNEHIYEMARIYFLDKQEIEHESDIPYGKVWTMIDEGYMRIIHKLFSTQDYNVILISHEVEKTEKSAIGTETTVYAPSLKEKLHSRISGRVHFVCRAYLKTINLNGEPVNQYKLSIGSTSNELSGQRLPVKKRLIDQGYEIFKDNLITK